MLRQHCFECRSRMKVLANDKVMADIVARASAGESRSGYARLIFPAPLWRGPTNEYFPASPPLPGVASPTTSRRAACVSLRPITFFRRKSSSRATSRGIITPSREN